MSGRWRAGVLVAVAVAVIAAVLLGRGCDEDAADGSNAGATPQPASTSVGGPKREPRRDDLPTSPPPAAPAESPAATLLVEGWPAAQIIVKRPDGTAAPGACVYVHPAEADMHGSMHDVYRLIADADGRATLVVPAPGRYDVGAFDASRFTTHVRDVEFPANVPVEVVLPELARLSIRVEGELPHTGQVTVLSTEAIRVAPFPGRRECRSTGFGTASPLPAWIDVPRGRPLRVDVRGGIAAEPRELTAPATLTLRSDGRCAIPFEFVFTGSDIPRVHALEYDFHVSVEGGEKDHVGFSLAELPASDTSTAPLCAELWCTPGPVEIRWELRGVSKGVARVDTWRRSESGACRIEIPVPHWKSRADLIGVRVASLVDSSDVVTEVSAQGARPGQEVVLSARGVGHVAAFGPRKGPVLVADPVRAESGRILELQLVPGGRARITVKPPQGLDPRWPISVERADALPILLLEPPGRIAPFLTAQPRIDHALVLGPFPAGDVELVFRLAGREFGRRTVTIRADETVDVAAPPIEPPPR